MPIVSIRNTWNSKFVYKWLILDKNILNHRAGLFEPRRFVYKLSLIFTWNHSIIFIRKKKENKFKKKKKNETKIKKQTQKEKYERRKR